MEAFGASQMQALADLLCQDPADDAAFIGETQGRHINPQKTEKYKSRAKPNFRVKTKVRKRKQ